MDTDTSAGGMIQRHDRPRVQVGDHVLLLELPHEPRGGVDNPTKQIELIRRWIKTNLSYQESAMTARSKMETQLKEEKDLSPSVRNVLPIYIERLVKEEKELAEHIRLLNEHLKQVEGQNR